MSLLSSYYNGTSAYKIDDFDYGNHKVHSAKENIERRRVAREGKKTKFVKQLRAAVTFLSVFAVALGVLFTNAVIIEKSSKVNDMQKELSQITEANNQIVLDIERNLDLKKIEEIAINELGMKHPDKYQIVYVDVEQSNYGEIVSDKKESVGIGGTVVAMGKGAKNIMEYMN